jgi:hypothetical protein
VIRRFLQASIIAIAAAIAGCSLGSFESITYVNAPVDTLDNEPAEPSEPAQPMAPIVIYGDSRTGHLTHIQVRRFSCGGFGGRWHYPDELGPLQ